MKKRPKENRGFSLIELIIAIAILVILTGLLAPQFMKYIERARKAKCLNNQDVILEEYQVRMIDAENIHDIDDAKALMEEVISDIGAECPSGGIYEVKIAGGGKKRSADADEGWLELRCTKHGGDGEAISSNPVIVQAQGALTEMQWFIGKTVGEIKERKNWEIINDKTYPNNNLFRNYILKEIYGGSWPQFDPDILKANGFAEGTTLYIQPYIDLVDKEWANPDSVNENNTFVYASTTSENKNWEAPLIYHPIEKTWYKAGPKSTQKKMKFANLSWSELSAMMSNDNWEAIKLN